MYRTVLRMKAGTKAKYTGIRPKPTAEAARTSVIPQASSAGVLVTPL